ncbi:MAG: ATP-dependent HslUV protease ATP-binding subunit HslU [Arenicella sp.]|jgi:ATP-dependent HslUV protease ATP-binding subunit HslU
MLKIKNDLDKIANLTPRQIVVELDKYIIGQKDAKKNVAIALRNRWRRMNADEEIQQDIMPNNILMIGATGVGKTEIARRLAKIANAPFVKVEASKFTEVGYVGRDVESMIRDLVEQSVNLVKTEKKQEVKEKVELAVEEIILDAIIPVPKSNAQSVMNTLDGDYIQESDEDLKAKTREMFRTRLQNREMEDKKIEVTVDASSGGIGVVGGGMDEMSMMNIQEMIGNMMPKKTKKRKITIAEARKILFEQESGKLIDMDEVKEIAVQKAENMGIVFLDEIDKIAVSSSKGSGPDVSREGVQRDLLPIVEGSAVNTKYGIVNTDHILFVSAGAFHVSKPSDLIPELQGRFPIRVELQSLTKDDFYQILKAPKNALTKQYEALFKSEQVELTFQDDSLEEIAEIAFAVNEEVENIGARRLQTVMSQLLNEFLFDVPDTIGANAKILITREMVQDKLKGMVKNKDLSQYIL